MTISGASRVRRRWAVSVAGRHGSLRPAGEFIASVTGLGNLLSPQSAYPASRSPVDVARVDAGARPPRCGSAGSLIGIRAIANNDHLTLGCGQFDAKNRNLTAWGSGFRHRRGPPRKPRAGFADAMARSFP